MKTMMAPFTWLLTKFKHIYQNLRHVLDEKPIESSTSIHSVAQSLTKEREKYRKMDRGRGERQRELQRERKRENGDGDTKKRKELQKERETE